MEAGGIPKRFFGFRSIILNCVYESNAYTASCPGCKGLLTSTLVPGALQTIKNSGLAKIRPQG